MSQIHQSSSAKNTHDEAALNQSSLDEKDKAVLSALSDSIHSYVELLIAQLNQKGKSIQSQFQLAVRGALMSVLSLIAFVVMTICIWLTISALSAVGLINLGMHWFAAVLTVLILNIVLAYYLLITARDLLKNTTLFK